jgi:hypothetical protein
MTESAVAVRQTEPTMTAFEVIERVITSGDLSKMSAQDRVAFYWKTCESLGLNPLTRPFEYIALSGKLTLYPRRDATDQLRKIHRVSVDGLEHSIVDDILTVTATGHTPDGRTDADVGSVNIKGLSGDARANATKKAITQAKRRLTLSLVGLGFLDESEIPGLDRDPIDVDPTTGEITERAKPKTLLESVRAQQEALATDPAVVEGEVVEPTDEPQTASFLDDDPPPAPMSQDELKARIRADGIDLALAERVFHETFPDAEALGALTDPERGIYWAALEAATA